MALVPFRRNDGPAEAAPEDDPWAESDEQEDAGAKMTFLEHLDELRKRLIISAAAVGVAFIISFAFVDQIYHFVMDPLQALMPKGSQLVYNEPTEAFVLYLTMALLAGVIIAMPVVLLQVWLFIAPGLYAKEKRLAIPFIVLASVGFVGGAASHEDDAAG
jgi:sec-independent protein translocase protein TatC